MRRRDQGPAAVTVAMVLLSTATPAVAAGKCDVPIAEQARVAAVNNGGSFTASDGRRVRLASVLAPRRGEPLAGQAKAGLASLIARKSVDLAFAEQGSDRHGDVLAHVFVGEGVWLQHALVAEGLARVHTGADMRRCAGLLFEVENEARVARRGIWAEPFYRVRKPDELDGDIGTFQIVEARVASVAARRNRVFVNFGPDYRTDFTVTVSPADRKRLAKEAIVPTNWAGKTVRVRGWLSLLNGPEIELTHPEQIQILE